MAKGKSKIVRRTYMIKPTDDEIDDLLKRAHDCVATQRTTWGGGISAYEQGIESALDWLLGNSSSHPFD